MRTKSVTDLARAIDSHLKRAGVSPPGVRTLIQFFEVIYFASLKTEEGKPLQLRIALVDPSNPDPMRPPRPRPYRWQIIRINQHLPFTVPNLVKLSKAADPWSSCLAVYFDKDGTFFIWGLVDQTVHFSTMLVRETESGYAPPGLFHVLTTGTADLTVYREHGFVARLAQDSLLTRQSNVFWSGPVSDRLCPGVEEYLAAVLARFGTGRPEDWDSWVPSLAESWISTLCRILIGIQRYRHGGALLIAQSNSGLNIKYRINYTRLPKALINQAVANINSRRWRAEIGEYLDKSRKNVPASLYLDEVISESEEEDYQDEITGSVRFIASLSCIDGLILARPDLSVRGFGVEIRTKNDVADVYLAPRPKPTTTALRKLDPNHFGTRHRSMMRHCMAHKNALGFVVSQDGEIRAMTRIEGRIVMWENLQVLSLWDDDFETRYRFGPGGDLRDLLKSLHAKILG